MMLWAMRERNAVGQRVFWPLLVGLIGMAWLALWLWGQSPYGRFLSHHSLDEARGGGVLLLVFVLGWTFMVVAMMLPTSLPLVALYRRVVQGRPDRTRLTLLLLLGYLAVWTAFGALVYPGDAALHGLLERVLWLGANAWILGAGTLLLAGLYQFTPLKARCLEQCRSPFSFIAEHWRGRGEAGQAFRLGVHHGLFCVGCCWSLMLLMFAVGVGSLGWLLALGALMAVEKNLPWGRRLSVPLGAGLLGWGGAVAAVALL